MTIRSCALDILEAGSIPVLLIRDGTVLDTTAAAAKIFAVPVDHFRGQPLTSLFPIDCSALRKEEQVVRYGERFLKLRAVPVGEAEAVFVEDVSEEQRRSADLRRKSAELTSALDSLPFDFWMNDMENRTILQNERSKALWGDKTGVHMEDVTPNTEILQKWRRTNARALEGMTTEGEITYVIQGEERTFRNIVAPIRDAGQVVGILGLNIDVTDYKHALEERDNLLKELHHRTKNHLQIILSMINIQKNSGNYSEGEILHRVEEQIHSISMIQEQLFRRQDHWTVELNEYFRDIVAMTQKGGISYTSSGQELHCSIERSIPAGIALMELLRSFNKPGDGEGTVSVTLTEGAPGVPSKVAPHVLAIEASFPVDSVDSAITTLVESMTQQIQGRLTFETTPQLRINLSFLP